MNPFSPESCSIVLCTGTNQEFVINGYATTDGIEKSSLWHQLVHIDKDDTHFVECTDENFTVYLVPFTKSTSRI